MRGEEAPPYSAPQYANRLLRECFVYYLKIFSEIFGFGFGFVVFSLVIYMPGSVFVFVRAVSILSSCYVLSGIN